MVFDGLEVVRGRPVEVPVFRASVNQGQRGCKWAHPSPRRYANGPKVNKESGQNLNSINIVVHVAGEAQSKTPTMWRRTGTRRNHLDPGVGATSARPLSAVGHVRVSQARSGGGGGLVPILSHLPVSVPCSSLIISTRGAFNGAANKQPLGARAMLAYLRYMRWLASGWAYW